jgi:RimJ/RimL family protein N-acetyltransferase
MIETSEKEIINRHKQNQMLKLATKSFYNELVKFGIEKSDIVTVSMQLLDYLMQKDGNQETDNAYYNRDFKVKGIIDNWAQQERLTYDDVVIAPVQIKEIPRISDWLRDPEIKNSFVRQFPEKEEDLLLYLQNPQRNYFTIHFDSEAVGVIGADNIDENSLKLEMKKFIGNTTFQGKGLGKRATFLFLYYVFNILDFNKVYIYSSNANLRNINLNSKFGFELEGVFFEDIRIADKKQDTLRMGLLKSRWLEIFYNFEV